MNERNKLDEAEYFLARMRAVENVPAAYRFELSAFLTAARSVLQYAYAEAKPSSRALEWYNGAVSSSEMFRYFKNKRNVSVHHTPIATQHIVTLTATDYASISDSISVTVQDPEGNIVSQFKTESPPPASTPASETSVSHSYTFADWKDPGETVDSLCARYLCDLNNFVADGLERGFISG